MFDAILEEILTVIGFRVQANNSRDTNFLKNWKIVFWSQKGILNINKITPN